MFDLADFGVLREVLGEFFITADRLLKVARSAFEVERVGDGQLRQRQVCAVGIGRDYYVVSQARFVVAALLGLLRRLIVKLTVAPFGRRVIGFDLVLRPAPGEGQGEGESEHNGNNTSKLHNCTPSNAQRFSCVLSVAGDQVVTLPPDSAARSNSFKASTGFSTPKTAYPATRISAQACSTTAICSPG